MDPDHAVDDELEAGQAHTGIRQLGKIEGAVRLPTFIMILMGRRGMLPTSVTATSKSSLPS